MNSVLRRSTLPAAVLALALGLTACGGSNDTTSSPTSSAMPSDDMGSMTSTTPTPSASTGVGTPATGAHNDADVAFATGMIPHHAQAVTMAEMAATKATNSDVKTLAATIKAAQAPEITEMSGWLTGWGQPVPDTAMGNGGMAMGDGMMTDAEMTQLSHATGAAFDRMWLQMMIKHHQGAVAMATTELASGSNGDAKKLAQAIITSQKAEIATMQKLEPTVG
jgi:uncharacterized protein (DUF305 family)